MTLTHASTHAIVHKSPTFSNSHTDVTRAFAGLPPAPPMLWLTAQSSAGIRRVKEMSAKRLHS